MHVDDYVAKRTIMEKVQIDVFFGNLLDKALIYANFLGGYFIKGGINEGSKT